MDYFLQQLINGLTLGSIYGLVAIGYTMVYGIIGMINFAHGDIFMVGSFLALIAFLALLAIGSSPATEFPYPSQPVEWQSFHGQYAYYGPPPCTQNCGGGDTEDDETTSSGETETDTGGGATDTAPPAGTTAPPPPATTQPSND